MRRLIERGAAALERIRREPRVRSEVGWVLLTQASDFVLMFVLLKLLTNGLGKREYGEYNLADTALVALTAVVLSPVQEPFVRQYHAFRELGALRPAGTFLFRWYTAATLGVVLLAGAFSARLGRVFELGSVTCFAAALVFAADRWRTLGHDIRNQRRERRAWALWHLTYRLSLITSMGIALLLGARTAAQLLFVQAAVAAAFSLPNGLRLVREVRSAPAAQPGRLPGLVVTFGAPFASLLIFQWLQNFSDRYVVKAMLDPESVGLYVAAYQVCGIPYTFLTFAITNLLTPIAYQRAGDGSSGARLWAADRLLLGGLAALLAVGLPVIAIYAWLGPQLLTLLTNDHFQVSRNVIVLLTLSRFFQAVGLVLQPIFAIHQRVARMLGFRVAGGILSIILCVAATRAYGLPGAALGSAFAFGAYMIGLALAPGGLYWMVSAARAR